MWLCSSSTVQCTWAMQLVTLDNMYLLASAHVYVSIRRRSEAGV